MYFLCAFITLILPDKWMERWSLFVSF